MRHARHLFVVFALLLTFVPVAHGQDAPSRSYYDNHRVFGFALQGSTPYDDFAADYNTGFGVHGIADYPLAPLFSLIGDLGWNRFSGAGEVADIDVWEISAGAKFNLGPFYMGGEVAYYSKVDNVNWLPSIGLRFERWEFAVRWKAAERVGWVSYRVGYYF